MMVRVSSRRVAMAVAAIVAAASVGAVAGALTLAPAAVANPVRLCADAAGSVSVPSGRRCPEGFQTLTVASQSFALRLENQIAAVDGLIDADGDGAYLQVDDCDDNDAAQLPRAVEVVDGLDNDCDGGVDEQLTPSTTDLDGDGFTPDDGDCNESDHPDDAEFAPFVFPGAQEISGNSYDDDCDSVINEVETNAKCWNGVDDDADGKIDASDPDCLHPIDPGEWIDLADTDLDTTEDVFDGDDDNDGIADHLDPMPRVAGG